MKTAREHISNEQQNDSLFDGSIQEAFIGNEQAIIKLGTGAVEKVVYLNAGPTRHLLSMPDQVGVDRQLQVRGGVIEKDGEALPYNKVGLDVETGELGAIAMDAEDGLDFKSIDSL